MENFRLPKLQELLCDIEFEADEIIVRFINEPSNSGERFLFLTEKVLSEGKARQWSGGFSTRYDKRPANQGGDQLHISGPQGKKWAYRYDGSRSEPHKYTLSTTNKIRDIVSQAFGINRSQIQEMYVRQADENQILIEITFK